MPYMNVKTNTVITPAQEMAIKSRLGQAVSCIGKSEQWLMVQFEPEGRLYFQGKNDRPLAFVSVRVYGRADSRAYDRLTGEITDILRDELQLDPSGVYVQYQETDRWGWNGYNL